MHSGRIAILPGFAGGVIANLIQSTIFQISLDKMRGSWVHALSSQRVLERTERTVAHILSTPKPVSLSCSRYECKSVRAFVSHFP